MIDNHFSNRKIFFEIILELGDKINDENKKMALALYERLLYV